MDRKCQIIKDRYVRATVTIAHSKIEGLIHQGRFEEAEIEVAIAEQEALLCECEQKDANMLASKAASFEDEAIKAGVPLDDLWKMEPYLFAEKWGGSIMIRKHLRLTTSLTVTQDIAAHLSSWRSAVPALPDLAASNKGSG